MFCCTKTNTFLITSLVVATTSLQCFPSPPLAVEEFTLSQFKTGFIYLANLTLHYLHFLLSFSNPTKMFSFRGFALQFS